VVFDAALLGNDHSPTERGAARVEALVVRAARAANLTRCWDAAVPWSREPAHTGAPGVPVRTDEMLGR